MEILPDFDKFGYTIDSIIYLKPHHFNNIKDNGLMTRFHWVFPWGLRDPLNLPYEEGLVQVTVPHMYCDSQLFGLDDKREEVRRFLGFNRRVRIPYKRPIKTSDVLETYDKDEPIQVAAWGLPRFRWYHWDQRGGQYFVLYAVFGQSHAQKVEGAIMENPNILRTTGEHMLPKGFKDLTEGLHGRDYRKAPHYLVKEIKLESIVLPEDYKDIPGFGSRKLDRKIQRESPWEHSHYSAKSEKIG